MLEAPLPADEADRLNTLKRLEILDTPPDPEFDALVRAAASLCDTPISLISIVDQQRQWFKASTGLPGVEATPRRVAFCAHAVLADGPVEVPDTLLDQRFADNPLVTGAPYIRFYAGFPLRMSNGIVLGTLCVIDRTPRSLDTRQRQVMAFLADSAAASLESWRVRRIEERAEQDRLIAAGPAVLARFVIDPAGERTLRYLSSNVEQVLGLSRDEALDPCGPLLATGGTVAEVRHAALPAGYPPDDARYSYYYQPRHGLKMRLRANSRRLAGAEPGYTEEILYLFDETELEQAEAALKLAETRLLDTIMRSPAVICEELFGADGSQRVLYVSPNAQEVTGHPAELLFEDKYWKANTDQATHESWPAVLQRAKVEGRVHWECRLRHPDGHWKKIAVEIRAVPHGNGAWLLTSSVTDVTRQREMEHALRQARDSLAALLANGPGIMLRCVRDGLGAWRVAWRSENYQKVTGYSAEDTTDPLYLANTIKFDPGHARAAILAQSQSGRTASWEYDFRHKNGHLLRFGENLQIVNGIDGQDELFVYIYDCTAQYRAAQELAMAKDYLETLLAGSPGALFQLEIGVDGDSRLTFVSDAITRLTGRSVAETMQDGLEAHFDPASRLQHHAALQRTLAAGAATYEARLQCSNQDWIWAQVTIRCASHDGLRRMTGYLLDITEARKTASDLARTRLDLDEAVQAGPGALLRLSFDRAGHVAAEAFATAAVERITGYALDETVRQDWFASIFDSADTGKFDAMRQAVLAFEPHVSDIRIRLKSGALRWIRCSLRPLHNDPDLPVSAIGYLLDITREKQQEAKVLHTATLATLGEMATSLAHELNQPLTIMSMAAQNAARALADPARHSLVEKSLRAFTNRPFARRL